MPALSNMDGSIRDALVNPIGSISLSKIVRKRHRVAIIVSDMTRPCPDKQLIPRILAELNDAGIPDEQISLTIANGMHRPMTERDCVDTYSQEVCERIQPTNHVCRDEENLSQLGKTSNLGIPLSVNKTVVKADLVISTGIVDTHIFAGYSGGGKSVMPGVSGLKTIENSAQAYLA